MSNIAACHRRILLLDLLPLRHLFLAKNSFSPRLSSSRRRSPAACRSFASCVSATEISHCFTAWVTCRPIRSPSSFATNRPPASRVSAPSLRATSAWRPVRRRSSWMSEARPFCLFAGGADGERARLRVFRWPVARGRELRRADHRLERGPRSGAPHGGSFDAGDRGHVLLPFRTRNARTDVGAAIIERPPAPKALREEGETGTRLTAMHHGMRAASASCTSVASP